MKSRRGLNKKGLDKKGLSEVVTTILIVLLVLVAVSIIGAFVIPFITKTIGQLSAACVSLDAKPTSCSYDSENKPTVRIERGSGEADLQELKLIFLVGEDNIIREIKSNKSNIPAQLESRTYSEIEALPSAPSSVKVAGLVKTESGSEKLCDASVIEVPCKAEEAAE